VSAVRFRPVPLSGKAL